MENFTKRQRKGIDGPLDLFEKLTDEEHDTLEDDLHSLLSGEIKKYDIPLVKKFKTLVKKYVDKNRPDLDKDVRYPYVKDTLNKKKPYKEMSNDVIIIPKDSSEQMKRVFVLLGSLNRQNTNPNILKEISSLVDTLYKDGKIDEKTYKHIYYRS